MTDVLDRRSSVALDEVEVAQAAPTPPASSAVSTFGRAALASLSVGAAVIHLVMVPSHLGEWTAEGVAFVVVGWVQILLAVVIATRATRSALWTGIALNVAFVGAWAWTRISGSPWGPHSGLVEDAGFVDAVCAGLEITFVVAALVFLARPSLGGGRAWVAAIIPIAVLGLTTAAIASPSARNHAHGGGEGVAHDHGSAASGGEHPHGAAMPADHQHGGGEGEQTGDDKGLGMLVNGHHGAMTIKPVDALTQAKLDGQLAVTREVAATYPTIADAVAAGYRRQGPYSPGLGIHYGRYNNMNADGVMDHEDLLNPMTIIYDGTEPTSKIAGFMYYSFAGEKPEGFIGPNDHWHYHTNTCIKPAADGLDAPLGADQQVTRAQCEAVGGSLMDKTGWMVHVWTVPDYPVDEEHGGVFGEHNPALTCPDGSYYVRPVDEWPDHPLNVCKSAA
jgi:hypothetical protein